MESPSSSHVPYRQIRAFYDDKTITVYQAYSASIASAAVREQRLNASPDFLFTRMTWIKPSWCWMMYRSGYAQKDPQQARILALRMTHANFSLLLSHALVAPSSNSNNNNNTHASSSSTPTPIPTPTTITTHQRLSDADKAAKPVRVQWDPERGPRLEVLPYRSIQIGIGRALSRRWVEEWIEGIEDVTGRAEALREEVMVESGGKKGAGTRVEVEVEELVGRGLVPREREYVLLGEEVRKVIGMDDGEGSEEREGKKAEGEVETREK